MKQNLNWVLLGLCWSLTVPATSGTAFQAIKLPVGKGLNSAFILEQIQLPQVGGALLCSIYCSRTWKCLTSIVSDDICLLYRKIEVVDDPTSTVEIKFSFKMEKVLLFRHVSPAGSSDWFDSQATHGSWNINENDPTAMKYSVLEDLENFRDKDGIFHFEMCYPDEASLGDDNCMVFDQTNDIRTADAPTGFVLRHIPAGLNMDASQCTFSGLRADSPAVSWLDGMHTSGTWWFSLGAQRQHAPETYPAGSFPGPCSGSGWKMVFHVELYAVISV